MSYRFLTAVREILKGLLRYGMLALIIQSNIHPLEKENKNMLQGKKFVYNYTCLLIFKQ